MALRIFRKDMFVSALIIVIAIFLIGFYYGDRLDDFRVDDATKILNRAELDSESFQVQEDFYNSFLKDMCSIDRSMASKLGKQLYDIGKTLDSYEVKKLTHKESYDLLKRKYFINELMFYNLKNRLNNNCNFNDSIILFFYDIEDPELSLRQGYILDILGRRDNNLTVISFDKDFDEESVRTLVNYYNIKFAPTLIVNYNHKFEGFTSESEIRKALESTNR